MLNAGKQHPRGTSLVEIVVTVLVLAVASVGALTYQYLSVKRAEIAGYQIMATRIAQVIIEDWKSAGGDENYDPTSLDIGFVSKGNNQYDITFDEVPMTVTLDYRDIDTDAVAGTTLREMTASVLWQAAKHTDAANTSSFVITTYTRRDADGG